MKHKNRKKMIGMKSFREVILMFLMGYGSLFAQKGLGTNNPNVNAALEIVSPDKGVLMPKINLVSSTLFLGGATATASHTGMLVYNTNTVTNTGLMGTGYYFWNGSQWEKFTSEGNLFWDLDRDTGIQVEESTDEDIIRFDTAGREWMTITSSGTITTASATIGIDRADPRERLEINNGNVTLGTIAPDNGSLGGTNYFLFGHSNPRPLMNNYGIKLQYDSANSTYGSMMFTGNLFSNAFISFGRPKTGITSWTHDNMEEWARFQDGKFIIGSTVTPTYTLTVSGTAHVSGAFYDSSTDSGTLGQILSSTATGTNWIDLALNPVPMLSGVGQLTDDGTLLLDDNFSTFVQGDYAYVASRNDLGIQIIDISDPANPVGVGQLTDTTTSSLQQLRNIFVQGDYAYTISQSEGFQIIDVSDPTNPVAAGQLVDDGTLLLNGSWDLYVQGNYAYVTSLTENGIQIIDISNPDFPRGVGQLVDDGSLLLGGAFSIFVQGNYAYVTSFLEDGLQIIDISDPTNPVAAGQLAESASVLLDNPYYSFVEGNYAYVPSLTEDGLQIIDISDPNNPVGVGQLADSADLLLDGAFRVFTQGDYAYVTAILEGLQVIDISDPANPVGVGQLADDASLHLEDARGLFVQGNHAYVTGSGGFQVVQLGTNELYGLDVGSLKTSSLQVDNHAQFNNYVDAKGGLSVGASSKFDGNVSLGSSLRDSSGDAGTSGQVLSSTVTGTDWMDLSISSITDTDGDTKIQVEEGGPGTDDDTIRFDTAGTQRMLIDEEGQIGLGGVVDPFAELHFSNNIDNRKLILWQDNTLDNDHQFYGFGISGGTLRYHVPQVADHIFYAGVSSTTSQQILRIRGNGNVGIGNGNPTHPFTVMDNNSFPFLNLNETNGNLDNYINRATAEIRNNNNGLFFLVSGIVNDRRTGIQAGHFNPNFADRNGELTLNPFGGNIGIGLLNPERSLDVNGRVRIRNLTAGLATNQIVTIDATGDLFTRSSTSIGTDSQTLAFDNASATNTQTTITLDQSQSLTLTASGSLRFNNTNSSTLELIGNASQLIDADGDTQIQVEESPDDDTIRFDTAGTERIQIDETGNIGVGARAATSTTLDLSAISDKGFELPNVELLSLATNGPLSNPVTGTLVMASETIADHNDVADSNFNNNSPVAVGPFSLFNLNQADHEGGNTGLEVVVLSALSGSFPRGTHFSPGSFTGPYVISFFVQNSPTSAFTSIDVRVADGGTSQWEEDIPVTSTWTRVVITRPSGTTLSGTSLLIGQRDNAGNGGVRISGLQIQQGETSVDPYTPEPPLGGTSNLGPFLWVNNQWEGLRNRYDSNGDTGSNGQVFSSTGSGTNWIDLEPSFLIDQDSDTQIQVEEGVDDDSIRFDTAGTQRMLIDSNGEIGLGAVVDPQAELHFSNNIDNRKLILWQNATFTNDDHQFYGFGISGITLRYHVPHAADHVFFGGTSSSTSQELVRIKGSGHVGIGGLSTANVPYTLTVSGTAQVTGALHDSDGDAGTSGQILSSTVTGTNWINTMNTVINELIFDGEEDISGTYDDYYYISMLINGTDWKVVRYDKTDVNAEAEATGTGAGSQPTTLADCTALTF